MVLPCALSRGERARVFRVAVGYYQSDVAARAAVPPGLVSAFERDFRIYPAALRRILDAYCELGLELSP